jgi:hypothetical protein
VSCRVLRGYLRIVDGLALSNLRAADIGQPGARVGVRRREDSAVA